VLFVAVTGWHAADHVGGSPASIVTSTSPTSLTAVGDGHVDGILPVAAHLADRSTVAEQVAVKRVEVERLAAVAAAATAVLLLLVGRPSRLAPERLRRRRLDRSGLLSRAPPPAFVS
jgi:hypothetical protein